MSEKKSDMRESKMLGAYLCQCFLYQDQCSHTCWVVRLASRNSTRLWKFRGSNIEDEAREDKFLRLEGQPGKNNDEGRYQ